MENNHTLYQSSHVSAMTYCEGTWKQWCLLLTDIHWGYFPDKEKQITICPNQLSFKISCKQLCKIRLWIYSSDFNMVF